MEKIKDLIRCVFQAEHDINESVIKDGAHKGMKWNDVFRQTKDTTDTNFKKHIAEEYVETLAKYIVENGWIKIND